MQSELLRVSGMTCGGCANKVTRALKAVSGVGEVEVSLQAGEAKVQFNERRTTANHLRSAVKAAGYGTDAANPAQSLQPKGGCCS